VKRELPAVPWPSATSAIDRANIPSAKAVLDTNSRGNAAPSRQRTAVSRLRSGRERQSGGIRRYIPRGRMTGRSWPRRGRGSPCGQEALPESSNHRPSGDVAALAGRLDRVPVVAFAHEGDRRGAGYPIEDGETSQCGAGAWCAARPRSALVAPRPRLPVAGSPAIGANVIPRGRQAVAGRADKHRNPGTDRRGVGDRGLGLVPAGRRAGARSPALRGPRIRPQSRIVPSRCSGASIQESGAGEAGGRCNPRFRTTRNPARAEGYCSSLSVS
jgi:hypothetical protein